MRLLLGILFLISLLARWYYVTHAQVLQPVYDQAHVRGDAVDYYAYARNLLEHHVFTAAPEGTAPLHGDSFRDPGYPVFLALFMALLPAWDAWYAAVLIAQATLGALTVLLLAATARRWLPFGWLAAAGLLMAIWPHSVAIASFLLSETLFGFLCALALWLTSLAVDRKSIAVGIAAGIACSLGALTNATLLPFAPCVAAYLGLRKLAPSRLLWAIALAFVVTYAPWAIRNATLHAQPASSDRALMNLVQGSWPEYHASYQAAMKGNPAGIATSQAIESEYRLMRDHPAEGWHAWTGRLASHPGRTIAWYLSKPALLWGWDIRIGQGDVYVYPTRDSPFKTTMAGRLVISLCHALNPLLGWLALAGCLVVFFRRPLSPPEQPLAWLLLMMTGIYSALQAEPRYSVALRGMEILAAAIALSRAAAVLQTLRAAQPKRAHHHDSQGSRANPSRGSDFPGTKG